MSSQDQTTTDQGTGVDERLIAGRLFDTAEKEPSISRFVEAIRITQFDNDLLAPDYMTLFAPTNEALDAAPDNLWNELLKPENRERLRTIVGRHIVHGMQTLADLKTAKTVKPFAGEPVHVSGEPGQERFGGARIIRGNITCRNGQMHIIDKLATPEPSPGR